MMSACADVLDALQVLIFWLDRHPFKADPHYTDFKMKLLKISIVLATNTNRDRFAERPVDVIRDNCLKLADLSDTLIQECQDPLILQPCYLDVASTKRKADEEDFGLVLERTVNGSTAIKDVRFGSIAHSFGRMEPGDEIIQVRISSRNLSNFFFYNSTF